MTDLAPLRRSLALRFAAAALVPILGAAVLILQHLTVGTVREFGARNLLLARAVRGQVEGQLREPIVALQTLREMLPQVQEKLPEGVEAHLVMVLRGAPLLESIMVVGADGRVRVVGVQAGQESLRRDLVGIDLGHQEFIREALATGLATWSDTYLSLVSGRISLSVCLPIGRGEVLLGSLDVGRLLEFTRRLPEGGEVAVSIVDRSGAIVAHSDPEVALRGIKVNHVEAVRRGFAGEEVTVRGAFLGQDVASSVVRIPETGWLVIVAQDAALLARRLWVAGLTLSGALLVAVGVALLFALTQSRRIAGPLAALAAGTRQLAAGGYEFVAPPSGSLEVHELSESFRRMAEAIGDRERRLRESEEKYRLLVEHAGDAIFVAQEGRLAFVNPRAVELAGVDAETLHHCAWEALVHAEDRERLLAYDRALLLGQMIPQTLTFRVVRPDGALRWLQMSSVLIDWEGRPATLNFARDITELKALESQALQAQKMEAVGTLAGGIAHDFNNLLQAIQGCAELALMPGRSAEANRRAIAQIVRSTERGADLTRQLLTFSRKVENRGRLFDLNEEVRQVAQMLERTLPKMVRVELELEAGLPRVFADPGQIQQVLLNLAVNAGQAMPEGGLLRIATATFETGADPTAPEIRPGRYVSIRVADTGAGIEERHRARIFDPFFTTKGPGEGSGLGLAMVFGIVKAHEGHVWFETEAGLGTVFTVLLPCPRAAGPEGDSAAAATERPAPSAAGICVLLVDDEEIVRGVGAELLASEGCRVLTAPDGESALAIYQQLRGEIDVVLLDQIMPGMGGRRCLEELLKLDPEVRVLVASGYAEDALADAPHLSGARGFVAKPFRMRTLLAAIRKALEPVAG